MKVVHVISGLGDGGAEAVLFQLCKSERDCAHIVVSMGDAGKYGVHLEAAGIPLHCLGMHRQRIAPHAFARLFRLFKQEEPQIVQTWMYHADLVGGLAAKVAGDARVCWGLHTSMLDVETLGRSTAFIARQCARVSRIIPHRIISCSEEGAKRHAAFGYANDRMVVIPNGYDIHRFRPDAVARARARAEWDVHDTDTVVGMVARFDPLKDHENFIAAVRRVEASGRTAVWVLVGPGMTERNDTLGAILQKYNVRSRLLLLGQRSDIPVLMNAFDIHVLSSRVEGFPNVLAEAMACGTPCVTTAVGDAPKIVGTTGWTLPPRDAVALGLAIGAAIDARNDARLWKRRCSAARSRIEAQFSADAMSRAYRETWQDALAETAR